jgi:hypothetical protein
MRIVPGARIALAAACLTGLTGLTGLTLAPSAHGAMNGAWATTVTCYSGTSATTVTPYAPRITSATFTNPSGSLWCTQVKTGEPTRGKLPSSATGPAQMQASATFNEAAAGTATGTAGGLLSVYFAGSRYDVLFDAVFVSGEGQFDSATVWDSDGSNAGVASGTFNEARCLVPGCAATFAPVAQITIQLGQVPPRT